MDTAVQAGLSQRVFLAGMAIIIGVLLMRWHRRSSRQTNDLRPTGRRPLLLPPLLHRLAEPIVAASRRSRLISARLGTLSAPPHLAALSLRRPRLRVWRGLHREADPVTR